MRWDVDDIDLSDMDFWRRPWAEREAAFALLRARAAHRALRRSRHRGHGHRVPPGTGYYAHDPPPRRRRRRRATPRPSSRVRARSRPIDLPTEMVEYFSGMISTDDPKHARLRRIVSNAFNPRNVRAVEDSIERKADEIIERARSRGHRATSSADVAAPFPLEIICDMMGVPAERVRDGPASLEHHPLQRRPRVHPRGSGPLLVLLESGAALTGIMEELGKYRVDHPIDDITSALVNAEIESEKLTGQELASFFVLLVTAGNETTRTAIAHGLTPSRPPRTARAAPPDYDALPRPRPTRSCAGRPR